MGKQYRVPALNRDHARPRTAPAPTSAAVEERLTALLHPVTFALGEEYRRLGLRGRVLTLPVMVGVVLTMIWRQVPAVTTLVALLEREGLLWVPPLRISQQAVSQRLRCLPATLFHQVLLTLVPTLLARAATRQRPQPAAVQQVLAHCARIWVIDLTTLEKLFGKVGLLRGEQPVPLGGRLAAVLDLPSKLPVQLWLDDNPHAHEQQFVPQLHAVLAPDTFVLFDRGFHAFGLFDWLTDHRCWFLSRMRSQTTFRVTQVLQQTAHVRDRIVQFGTYRSDPCQHPVRLIEVCVAGVWHRYLTNVLDPAVLPVGAAVELYGYRWRIEEAFLIVKRLLGLAYLWSGAFNALALQIWATWVLYAVLLDLGDAIAEELDQPLEQISVEMVYRGLYFFAGAAARGEATDPVAYLAAQTRLGIVKRRRKARERAHQALLPPELRWRAGSVTTGTLTCPEIP